jgi:hypothetical protein
MELKKSLTTAGILAGFLFLFYTSGIIGAPRIPGVLPILVMTYALLSAVFLVRTDARVVYALAGLLVVYVLLLYTPLPICDTVNPYQGCSCDCLGVKRYHMKASECVGYRTHCYTYTRTEGNASDAFPEIHTEVPCD